MVGVFRAGMAVHFSPKDLGLNAEIFETVFGVRTGFMNCLQAVRS